MKIDVNLEDAVIDLGLVTTETRGIGNFGPDDVQTGQRYLGGGIQTDD